MNELFFWSGIVLAVFFFILSIVLFFTLKIPQVISFFLKAGSSKNTHIPLQNNPIAYSGNQTTTEHDTILLGEDDTQLLNIAQNYATALLDAESTSLLNLNENEEEFEEDFTLASSNKVLFDKQIK